jgi:two-component system, OmpR family, phosphate regulon sensor histidine kinase PhoR
MVVARTMMDAPLILLAEDSREILAFLTDTVLKPAGYAVQAVSDGLSALTLARQLQPDLLITDHNMPNLTGLELIRRVRSDRPHCPAILITADGSESLAIEALRAGACDYLVKPFESDQLLAAVARALKEGREGRSVCEANLHAQPADNVQRRLTELEGLAQIGRAVTAMLDLDAVLKAVVDAAVKLTGAEEGSLLLLDEPSNELYMRSSKNFDEEFASTFRLRVQDSLAGQVIASGQPVLLDERSPQKIKTSYLVHSLLYVPLRVRGRTIGVLGVDNRKAGRALTQEDVTVMSAIADYAAIAIDNARLYQKTEADLRKLETVLTQTEDAVLLVDLENRLLMANGSACAAFGVDGVLIGRSLVESFDDPNLLELVRAPSHLPRRSEIAVADGRVFNAQRTPIPGVGQAVVMQDITHLKELDRIKSEFVTTVSHDLRSPLTAILGYVELIARAGPVNVQQAEFIRRVRVSVEHITALISDLLDLGRIEAGLDSAKEPVPLSMLARYAVDGLRGVAETRGLRMEADLPDDLPLLPGDSIRLRQMIGNLIENAIKYTPEGGTVRVDTYADQDQVILRVQDTGRGIPPADQPYLFDKFYRAGNVAADTSGTGLGLSIVKSIVDHHHGRVWVESSLGKGSCFTVVLPAAVG